MTTGLTVGLLALIVVGVTIAALLHAQWTRGLNQPTMSAADITFYQAATLAGGAKRVALTSIAYLVWTGMLEVREGSKAVALLKPPPPNVGLAAVEEAILRSVTFDGQPITRVLGPAIEAAHETSEEIPELVVPPSVGNKLVAIAVIPAVFAAIAALAAIVVMVDEGRSVGLLPAVPVVAVVVVLAALVGRIRLTPAGTAMLRQLQEIHSEDLDVAVAGVTSLPIEQGIYIVALHGRPALTGGLGVVRRITSA